MIRKLDHVNILTKDIGKTLTFYTDVLGMRSGRPPGMDERTAPGDFAWIYDDSGAPAIHVQAVDPTAPHKTLDRVRERLGPLAGPMDFETLNGSGSIEHVAFQCSDYDGVRARIDATGLPVRLHDVPGVRLRQIFVNDPNGIVVELNFPVQ